MALSFNGRGSGQHVDLGTFDLSSGLTELSIFTWVIFDSFGVSDARMLSKATSSSESAHYFMLSSIYSGGKMIMRGRLKTNGSTKTFFESGSTPALSLNTLHHVGYVYNGSTVLFYRDGDPVSASSSLSGTIDTSASTSVRIADNPGTHRKELDGTVEDTRIYERALSANEVKTIFSARGRDSVIYKLKYRWILNEDSCGQSAAGKDSIKDLMGNANGTPSSNPVYQGSNLTIIR